MTRGPVADPVVHLLLRDRQWVLQASIDTDDAAVRFDGGERVEPVPLEQRGSTPRRDL